MTSHQIAEVLFPSKQGALIANRRLRILYEYHCVNRFRPFMGHGMGTAPFHYTIGRAGALILSLEGHRRLTRLPASYPHTVAVADFRIAAQALGFGWGEVEKQIGPAIADVLYPQERIAVEVDMGTQNRKALALKVARYKRVVGLRYLVFITHGNQARVDYFWRLTRGAGFRAVCARWEDLGEVLQALKKAPA